ncbi:MAG: hypothetical protein II589_01020 [Clostridia bacterium]|nr:hypothetical protein [Clostridia bacterium]
MNKKFISVIMAATLALSSAAICASAAEVDIQPSKESGKIRFDKGKWDHGHSICFYIWATKEGEKDQFWVQGNWQEDAKWASKKIIADDVEGDTQYCEMEVDIMDGWNTFIIFNDIDTGDQTFDCVLTPNAFGDTAHMTDEMIENPEDSEKQCIGVYFDSASDCGSHLVITSTGNVVGNALAPNDDPNWIVANALYKLLGKMDKSGVECCTQEKVDNWVSAFGTTKEAVWEKFQTFDGQEGREDYAAKVDDVKKLLGVGGETDTTSSETTSSEGTSSTEGDTSSSTSSSSTSSSSTSSTSSKSTTTTTTTSKTTTTTSAVTTTGETDTAATGDVTGTAAFAGVLLAAAATIVVTRKKVEE